MQYLAWWILTGLNKITLSLIVRHTKFSPDWCFGLLKQAFCRTKVGCLDDIARVVEESVVNHAQLVGSQDGEIIVPTYDWVQFFDSPFRQKALKGIKTMHHLTFTDSNKGSVLVRDDINSPEREIKLVQDDEWSPSAQALPPIIPPSGLSLHHRQYRLENIREFCPPHC